MPPPPPPRARRLLTEAEAKAKAEKLKEALKGGADFVKLVKENSDDETSRDKDGDFATLRFTDNIPDAFRTAVFALKKGEVSEPLKQPNGFYLLRADEVTVRPLSEVRDDIFNDLKNDRATRVAGQDQPRIQGADHEPGIRRQTRRATTGRSGEKVGFFGSCRRAVHANMKFIFALI